jgi:RNA polymerase sigma factor (sigma-70 family)
MSELELAHTNGDLPSWKALLSRALDGDRDGFHRLFEAVLPWLQGLAQKYMSARLRTVMEADDIVNIASERIYTSLPRVSFETDARFRNWMHEIVKNTAFEEDRDHFRTLKRGHVPKPLERGVRQDAPSDASWCIDLAAGNTPPPKQVVRNEFQQSLRQALDSLETDDRWILEERFFKGRAADVLARERGCTPRSVNRDLRVALERLRIALKDRGLGESGVRTLF